MFLIEGDGKSILYTGDVRGRLDCPDTLCRPTDNTQLSDGGPKAYGVSL